MFLFLWHFAIPKARNALKSNVHWKSGCYNEAFQDSKQTKYHRTISSCQTTHSFSQLSTCFVGQLNVPKMHTRHVVFANETRCVWKRPTFILLKLHIKCQDFFSVERRYFTREIQRKKNGETKILHSSFFILHFFVVPL